MTCCPAVRSPRDDLCMGIIRQSRWSVCAALECHWHPPPRPRPGRAWGCASSLVLSQCLILLALFRCEHLPNLGLGFVSASPVA